MHYRKFFVSVVLLFLFSACVCSGQELSEQNLSEEGLSGQELAEEVLAEEGLSGQELSEQVLANRSLFFARDAMDRMTAAGFSVIKINQTLVQAENAFEVGMYGQVVQLCNSINSTAANAFRVYSLIDGIQAAIDESSEKGFDVSDASDLLDVARTSFEMEDYAETERFVNKAKLANQAAGPGRNIYLVVAEVFVLLVVVVVLFYHFVYPVLLRRRLKALRTEEATFRRKSREIVQQYYESKVTRDEFEKLTKVSEYQLADVQGKIAFLEARLSKKKRGGKKNE